MALKSRAGRAFAVAGLVLAAGTAAVAPAQANIPGGSGGGCAAQAYITKIGSTVYFKVAGSDCGTPPYLVRIWLHYQQNSTGHDVTYTCPLSGNQQACANAGLTRTMSDPAGTQFYQAGGDMEFYSITGTLVYKQSVSTNAYL